MKPKVHLTCTSQQLRHLLRCGQFLQLNTCFHMTVRIPHDYDKDAVTLSYPAIMARDDVDRLRHVFGSGLASADVEPEASSFVNDHHMQVELTAKQHERMFATELAVSEFARRFDVSLLFEFAQSSAEPRRVVVSMQGTQAACRAAHQVLLASLMLIVMSVPIAFYQHGLIIGKNGRHVRKLLTDYDNRIAIHVSKSDRKCDTVQFCGNDLDLLERAISDVQRRLAAKEKETYVQMKMPSVYHGLIIGRAGETIKTLQNEYSVRIQVDVGDDLCGTVTIRGSADKCHAARSAIESLRGMPAHLMHVQLAYIPVEHGCLLAHTDRKVRSICRSCCVTILYAGKMEENRTDVFIASDSSAADCQVAWQRLLDVWPIVCKVPVAFDQLKTIIGTRGDAIRQMRSQCAVSVSVPSRRQVMQGADSCVSLAGSRHNVDVAFKYLVDVLMLRLTFPLLVDQFELK